MKKNTDFHTEERDCVRCGQIGTAVAEGVRKLIMITIQESYESAGISGLCAEGRWDVALDALRALDLNPAIAAALRADVIR